MPEEEISDRKIVETVFEDLQHRMASQGLDFDAACNLLLTSYGKLIPNYDQILNAAKERYLKEQQKIEYIRVAAIPRRRHEPWYGGPNKNGIWETLRCHLSDGDFSEEAIDSIDDSSSKILSLLESPGKPSFSTRALVLGYVQSGKTANMTAVIAKAVDAGYHFVIVLAGLTNALRKQTEERLEEGLFNLMPHRWDRYTTVDHDFGHPTQNGFPRIAPTNRAVAIVKKNSHVLKRMFDMIDKSSEAFLRNTSFLIIDDECDQASVNASKYKEEMTAINGRIRMILHRLPKSAYIGYTATPFANVLIDPSISPENPEDLYPRDFIVSLPKPSGYFGTEELFGKSLMNAGEDDRIDDGLDMIRSVPYEEISDLRPNGYRDKDTFSLSITKTLEDSICYFVMASAARYVRGDGDKPSCMLIHTSVYQVAHFDAASRIKAFMAELAKEIQNSSPKRLEMLEELWKKEHTRVPSEIFNLDPIEYNDLKSYLKVVAKTIDTKVENGISSDRLDFSKDGPHKYIVVGGSVLARGLTIKGLTVSFFLRTSSQYDSVMQMGRWFGYRKGYDDLPRVWMADDMRDAFKDLATVEAEIREEISEYETQDISPLDFGIRIRRIPGMAITAKNKMLASEDCNISFSNAHIQTTRFYHKDPAWLDSNWDVGSRLIDSVLEGNKIFESGAGGRFIRNIDASKIITFLSEYQTHGTHKKFELEKLLGYIEKQNMREETTLTSWNIGVIEPSSGSDSDLPLGGLGKVKTVERSIFWEAQDGAADIKSLMSKQDIKVDTPAVSAVGGWKEIKALRQNHLGAIPLLLLYVIDSDSQPKKGSLKRYPLEAVQDILAIALSFPESEYDTPVYVQVSLPDSEYDEEELALIDETEDGLKDAEANN